MAVIYAKQRDATFPQLRAAHRDANRVALTGFFAEQRRRVVTRFRSGLLAVADAEEDIQLTRIIFERNRATAVEFGRRVVDMLAGKRFEPDLMDPWLIANAQIAAENINNATSEAVFDAMPDGEDGLVGVFDTLTAVTAGVYAQQMVTTAANFGAQEAAVREGAGTKTWMVNSANPRQEHAAMAGQTVSVRERFSNGLAWPGDPAGGPENNAGCQCSLAFS